MRKTWKMALSGLLTMGMVLSACTTPAAEETSGKESEKTSEKAAEETYTDVYSEDYASAGENSKWTSAWEKAEGVTDGVKDQAWNTWTPGAQKAEFTAVFSDLAAGEYRFSITAVGGDMDASDIMIGEVSKELFINAWNDSGTYDATVTDSVKVEEKGTLKVVLKLSYKDKGWCNLDDIKLQKKAGEAELLLAEKQKLTDIVTECKALNESWYPERTWKGVSLALTAAEEVLAKTDAAASDYTSAYKKLKAAKNKLIEKDVYVNKVEGLSQDFMRGVDISSYVSVVESGAQFKDAAGSVLDDAGFFKLLKDSGVNWVRIRVWNDPYDAKGNGYGAGNNDIEKAVKMGKWATAAGLRVLIDFHYSDFWADPDRQLAPKAWKDFSVAQKEEALYQFTKESLKKLTDAGVDVGMVQIGNETNSGLAGETDWENMAKLFKAGSKAVREAGEKILTAVHFTDPQIPDKLTGFAENLKKYEVDYDVFASSYYPATHGTMENITKVLSDVAKNYGKKVMVAETSWAWTTDDGDGHSQSFDAGTYADYAITVQGQATEVRDVVEAVSKVEGGAGIGVFYWEPAWIPAAYAYDEDGKKIESIYNSNKEKWEKYGSGVASSFSAEYAEDAASWYGGSVKDNEAFFDFEGNPLPSLTVFKDVYEGRKAPVLRVEKIKNGTVEVLLESSDVKAEISNIQAKLPQTVTGIYNDSSRKEFAVTWKTEELKEKITAFGNYTISGTVSYKDEFEKEVTKETACDISVFPNSILKNGDFENLDDGSWILENADTTEIKWNDTPMRGEGTLHFWNEGVVDFTMKQTVKAEQAGYYCASMYVQGAEDAANVLTISIKNLTDKSSAAKEIPMKGWNVWQTETTDSVSAKAGDELRVLITVKGAAGAWGSIDDVFLYKTNQAPKSAEKDTKKNACKKVKAVKKIYTIKKKGETVEAVFTITAADNGKKTTDQVTAVTKSKKIAKVTTTKVQKGKVIVTVKGLKKGKTVLTVKVGKKSEKTAIQVKK